jgi:enoyl-CoA hydratase/carnithine racemase
MSDFVAPECLGYAVTDRKAYISMNRPQAMNALNMELRQGIHDAFHQAVNDDAVLVIILTSEGGRAFSAGADLKEMSTGSASKPNQRARSGRPDVARPGNLLGWDAVNECPKPVIAAIDGYCLAGGLELAVYCDIRVATAKSTFGMPEPRRSLLGGPGLINLSRMIPFGEAMRLQLTGSPISARRAYELGLVQDVLDDREALMLKVDEIAAEIVECAPLAVQYIKRIVKEGRGLTEAQTWAFAEMFRVNLADSADALEGPRAFAEKRRPDWKLR